MKLVVDIPPDAYRRIVEVLESDKLSLVTQYIRLAIQNQLALEEVDEGLYLPDAGLSSLAPELEYAARVSSTPWKGLRRDDIAWDQVNDVPTPPVDAGPLWGQYNRFLPMKVATRVLSRLLISTENTLHLEEYHQQSTRTAIRARRFLSQIDEENTNPPGQKLSTAFPRNSEKSVRRFESHFLGYLRRDGEAVGALPELGFLSIESDPQNRVHLTRDGLEFARLSNPVIDEGVMAWTPLGPDEVRFLLSHLETSLPGEHGFMVEVLRWVSEGQDSPDELTKRVQRNYPDWTRKVANTMRAGVVGRMQELGLMTRSRDGRRITYSLRAPGEELLGA